jgi:hypothetical protein
MEKIQQLDWRERKLEILAKRVDTLTSALRAIRAQAALAASDETSSDDLPGRVLFQADAALKMSERMAALEPQPPTS